MDYLVTPTRFVEMAANSGAAIQGDERRKTARFPLSGRVAIDVGKEVFRGKLIDISSGGLSVLIPPSLKEGQSCRVLFIAVVNEQVLSITGTGKVANCICTPNGFRIGMLFEGNDDNNKQSIETLIQHRKRR